LSFFFKKKKLHLYLLLKNAKILPCVCAEALDYVIWSFTNIQMTSFFFLYIWTTNYKITILSSKQARTTDAIIPSIYHHTASIVNTNDHQTNINYSMQSYTYLLLYLQTNNHVTQYKTFWNIPQLLHFHDFITCHKFSVGYWSFDYFIWKLISI
jgi:regulator of sigma D